MIRILVISKSGCHICEMVTAALRSLSSRHELDIEVLDIMKDRALHDEYFLRIPVVRMNGVDVFDAHDIFPPEGIEGKLETLVSSIRG